MTWIITDGCFGCGRCTFCSGIEMKNRTAHITEQNSPCISQAAQICPAGIIQQQI